MTKRKKMIKGLKLEGVFDLSKLGIVLLILAAVIGIGFGIFQIAKGTANEGVSRRTGRVRRNERKYFQ